MHARSHARKRERDLLDASLPRTKESAPDHLTCICARTMQPSMFALARLHI
jgi:hypothetical protein